MPIEVAIKATLLSRPVDLSALISDGRPIEGQLDAAFANLMSYARANWNYTASSRNGGADLLAGTATSAPCGGIATALKIFFIEELGLDDDDVEYVRVTGYLWTGPNYLCFDKNVVGNIRTMNSDNYGNGCIFNEHYYLKAAGKYYDPCLSTAYSIRDQSIKEKFAPLNRFKLGRMGNRMFLTTADGNVGFCFMPGEIVSGFSQGAYCMFDLTKKNIEKVLGKVDFKAEMNALGGTTAFAKMVNGL